MRPITLYAADQFTPADRASLLNAAYADYHVPLHLTPEQIAGLDAFYDVDLALSPMAVAESEPVGMALLARRGGRGWVSAVGVVPGHRRRGVARAVMAALIANARHAGLRVLTLEVIDANVAARALYRGLGFVETRELLCWRFPPDADPLPIPAERLVPADMEDLWHVFAAWHDQPVCWQREPATLRRMAGQGRSYALTLDGVTAAYCLVTERPDTVALLDVGLNPAFGPVVAGRILLQALSSLYRGRALTTTNVPADSGLNKALAALHFTVTIRQWEMQLALATA